MAKATMSLGSRMREYMDITNYKLMQRTPVIIFVDGRAFHTYTRQIKAEKPFDDRVIMSMGKAAKYMCEHIEGAKLAYVQSDEITLLVTNYDNLNQGAFFDFRVQKLASISASLATVGFNQAMRLLFPDAKVSATFDARCFNLDREEVANWFVHRQQDWTRNSIQMCAQSKFSQRELNGKNCNELQDMLFKEHSINWNNLPSLLKRGSCVLKDEFGEWVLDREIPIFTQNRTYINKYVFPELYKYNEV